MEKSQKAPLFSALIKSVTIISLLCLSPLRTMATNIDSLRAELKKSLSEKDIGEAVQDYKSIGSYFHHERIYDSAVYYFSEAMKLDLDLEEEIHCLVRIGNIYVDSTNYKLALNYLYRALKLDKNEKEVRNYPEIYNLIGMCYGLTNKMDSAIYAFEKSLEYNIQLKDDSGIGLSYYNIGLANHFKGIYDLALEYFIKSANIREANNDTTALITSLISVGEVFRMKEDYSRSEEYYARAIRHKSHIEGKETLAYLYSELALLSKKQEKFNHAYAYIDTAMQFCLDIGYKRGIATLLDYEAGIEKVLGNFDKAYELYNTAKEDYRIIGFETGIVQSNIAIAEILLERKQYSEAIHLLDSTELYAQSNQLLDEQTQIAELKYKTYVLLGKVSLGLSELEYFITLKDSLYNIEKEEKIAEVETKYQTEQKEKQIELLDKENKLKEQKISARNYLLISLFVLSLLTVSLSVLLIKRRKTLSELDIEKSRHQLLRSQMNPHFIFNALSAIQNFILQNKPMDSVAYISEFSSLTRLVLEGARCDLITLEDDIKLVNNYLKLQQLRLGNKFSYVVRVNEKIDTELIKIPPMLSQPFIENAVEHGMRNKKEGEGKIEIEYVLHHSDLYVIIFDNGEGIANTVKETQAHKSLAGKITNERIENIRKTLNLNITLNIESIALNGTTVKLIIPQS